MAVRWIRGIKFVSTEPGHWYNEGNTLGIFHMMVGTPHVQWELWKIKDGQLDDMLDYGILFGDVVRHMTKGTI